VPGVVLPGEAVPVEGVEGCCAGGAPPCCVPLCGVEDCCPPCCCPSGTLATLVEVTSDAAIIKAPNCPAKLFLMATSGGSCPDYTPVRAPSCAEFLGCTSYPFSLLDFVNGRSQMSLVATISTGWGRSCESRCRAIHPEIPSRDRGTGSKGCIPACHHFKRSAIRRSQRRRPARSFDSPL